MSWCWGGSAWRAAACCARESESMGCRWAALAAVASLQDGRASAAGAAFILAEGGAADGIDGACADWEEWDGKLWYDVVACWSRGWGASRARGPESLSVADILGTAAGALGRATWQDAGDDAMEDAPDRLAAVGFHVCAACRAAPVGWSGMPCTDGEALCGGGDGEELRSWSGVAAECFEVVEGAALRLLQRGSRQGWHLQRFLSWVQLAPADSRHADVLACLVSAVSACGSGCSGAGQEARDGRDAGLATQGVGAGASGGRPEAGGARAWSSGACEHCEQVLALHMMLVLTRNLDCWVELLARECSASLPSARRILSSSSMPPHMQRHRRCPHPRTRPASPAVALRCLPSSRSRASTSASASRPVPRRR